MSAGYGIDTWCFDALVPGRYARGALLVTQAIYRRLTTPRGTLQPLDDGEGGDEEGAYGFDVASYVGGVGYQTAIAALPSQVRNEILKDDRVSTSLDVTAVLSMGLDGLDAIELSIYGELADESETFELTLSVSDRAVALLGVG